MKLFILIFCTIFIWFIEMLIEDALFSILVIFLVVNSGSETNVNILNFFLLRLLSGFEIKSILFVFIFCLPWIRLCLSMSKLVLNFISEIMCWLNGFWEVVDDILLVVKRFEIRSIGYTSVLNGGVVLFLEGVGWILLAFLSRLSCTCYILALSFLDDILVEFIF